MKNIHKVVVLVATLALVIFGCAPAEDSTSSAGSQIDAAQESSAKEYETEHLGGRVAESEVACDKQFVELGELVTLTNSNLDKAKGTLETSRATVIVAEAVHLPPGLEPIEWCLDDLVFSEGASIYLQDGQANITVLGRMRPNEPQQIVFRSFRNASAPGGADGARGANGPSANGPGKDGADGDNGRGGEPGSNGRNGTQLNLTLANLPALPWTADLSGQDGGDGGDGGNGGNGGNGADGRPAATGVFDCKRGGQAGGDGGNGGNGGDSALGGNCGNGGLLSLFVPADLVPEISRFISLVPKKSQVGSLGLPGLGGEPGRGGHGGRGQAFCSSGRRGRDGQYGQPGQVPIDTRLQSCLPSQVEIREVGDD